MVTMARMSSRTTPISRHSNRRIEVISSNPMPPRADHAEHRRGAHADFEPVEVVGHELRQRLRQHREGDDLQPAGLVASIASIGPVSTFSIASA